MRKEGIDYNPFLAIKNEVDESFIEKDHIFHRVATEVFPLAGVSNYDCKILWDRRAPIKTSVNTSFQLDAL